MKREVIKHLTKDFESCVNHTRNDIEFWFARDLQYLLGYDKWDYFLNIISKARIACDTAGHDVQNHFAGVGKMVRRCFFIHRGLRLFEMLLRFLQILFVFSKKL